MAQSVSDLWRNQHGARELVGRVEFLSETGQAIRTTDLDSTAPIKVIGANVSHDRSRTVWGDASCQILVGWDRADEIMELLPTSVGAPLAPTGGVSFRVSAGFRYMGFPLLGPELVYCGRFDIDTCEVVETAEGLIVDLGGVDLLGRVDVADIPYAIDIPWGDRIIDSAKLLINEVIPWMVFQEDPSDYTSARMILGEKANRLQQVRNMLTMISMEAYVEYDGSRIVMRRPPTTMDNAAWVYRFDQWGETIRLSSGMDRRRIVNGVVITGENPNSTDEPVQAEAWITDLADPTHYVKGPPVQTIIGPRPYFMSSPWIWTTAQAQDAANTDLRRLRGLMQKVRLRVAVNPAINPGDIIDVTRPGLGITGRYMVEAVAFSLDSSTMDLVCQERRV